MMARRGWRILLVLGAWSRLAGGPLVQAWSFDSRFNGHVRVGMLIRD
jgi:hypothetical protein